MNFNYQKYKEFGKKDSCTFYSIHPDLTKDEFMKAHLRVVADHIRDNYDMETLVRL